MKISWIDNALQRLNKHGEEYGFPYVLFSLYELLNFVLDYPAWIWQNQNFLYPYLLIKIEIISFSIFFLLSLRKYWFKGLQKYYPLCWLIGVIWSQPFANTLYFFHYYNSPLTETFTNISFAIFTLILIVDWLSFTIILFIGICLGILAQYILFGNIYLPYETLTKTITNLGWIILVGILFSRNTTRFRRNLQLEKQLTAVKMVCASIAHELRTPLLAIKSGAGGIANYLPKLLTTYRTAAKQQLDIPEIHPRTLEHIDEVVHNIESEVNASNIIIDTLLANASQNAINPKVFVQHTMKNCVESALLRFSFNPSIPIEVIHFNEHNDFYYRGDELLMTHVIFNLLRNAIYAIEEAGKGEIYIWFAQDDNYNTLHFKDTGKGISEGTKKHLFEPFYSTKSDGTGMGLPFCETVIHSFKGKISVDSELGVYTEFILYFPAIPPAKE